jgi:hypothetical protein
MAFEKCASIYKDYTQLLENDENLMWLHVCTPKYISQRDLLFACA